MRAFLEVLAYALMPQYGREVQLDGSHGNYRQVIPLDWKSDSTADSLSSKKPHQSMFGLENVVRRALGLLKSFRSEDENTRAERGIPYQTRGVREQPAGASALIPFWVFVYLGFDGRSAKR